MSQVDNEENAEVVVSVRISGSAALGKRLARPLVSLLSVLEENAARQPKLRGYMGKNRVCDEFFLEFIATGRIPDDSANMHRYDWPLTASWPVRVTTLRAQFDAYLRFRGQNPNEVRKSEFIALVQHYLFSAQHPFNVQSRKPGRFEKNARHYVLPPRESAIAAANARGDLLSERANDERHASATLAGRAD